MIRAYVTLLIILLLGCAPHARIDSVQALKFRGQTYCTAWSVNEQEGYWASAGHCALGAMDATAKTEGEFSTLDGVQAAVIYIDPFVDVAIFQADVHADAFKLAKKAAEVGDGVIVVGFPFGLARARTAGSMAIRSLWLVHPIIHNYVLNDVLDLTTAPGNSGSPVFDVHGKVVGLLWGGFGEVPMSLTVPLDALRTSIGRFFRPR